MSDTAIQIGGVVKLRSGGLEMTVVAIKERQPDGVEIQCAWFESLANGGQTKAHDYFPPAALRKVSNEQ